MSRYVAASEAASSSKRSACASILEAEHRAPREVGPAASMCSRAASPRGCRCMTGMPSTTGKMQHWQPRMPSWISSPSSGERRGDEFETAAAVRAAQDVESVTDDLHELVIGLARCCFEDIDVPADRRTALGTTRRAAEMFDAEQRRACSVDPARTDCRAHLRPVAAQRGQLARDPVAHVDHERRRLRRRRRTRRRRCPRTLRPARVQPRRAARPTTSRITPCGIVT